MASLVIRYTLINVIKELVLFFLVVNGKTVTVLQIRDAVKRVNFLKSVSNQTSPGRTVLKIGFKCGTQRTKY